MLPEWRVNQVIRWRDDTPILASASPAQAMVAAQ
jgi:hypothetical protein